MQNDDDDLELEDDDGFPAGDEDDLFTEDPDARLVLDDDDLDAPPGDW